MHWLSWVLILGSTGLYGSGKKNEKKHSKRDRCKKVKSIKSLSLEEDLESHAFKGNPLESHIMDPFLFFLSLQNQWHHFNFSVFSVGIQTSLNTTEGVQFVSKTQRLSNYYYCLPSHSMQKAWQFERILSSRLQKSRAMYSKLDARISRRLFYMQKAQYEWSYFQKSALLSALQHCVCNVCSTLGSLCAALCKLTMKQWIHSRLQVVVHMYIYFHLPRECLLHISYGGSEVMDMVS